MKTTNRCSHCGAEIDRRRGYCLECERRLGELDLETIVRALARLPVEKRRAIVRGLNLEFGR
jgi:predicted amidophosphoribosyltransferase